MKHCIVAAAAVIALTLGAAGASASTASQREYKRGYADCKAGRWDENQHGESYKKGCRAAEDQRTGAGTGAGAATTPADGASPAGAGGLRGDKTACLLAVKRKTNNPKVVVLSVETAEANNTVTIGVGPDRAPWRCLVKRGIVADVMSLTDEGKL
ncbi:MAG: hypothetical protein ACR65X_02425 [Methylocystis sp.]